MPASTFISGRARAQRFVFSGLLLLVLLNACGTASRGIALDPYFESFFEKARLIMTREEIQIYKHLPDDQARDAFIDEFWKKRDPDPATAENENKIEFERRIAYANRWFKENRALGRGWDTQRGRIFLQLGEPDNRYLTDMINNPQVKGYEHWIYYNYQLELIFIDKDGFGEFKLQNWPAELLTAISQAQFSMNLTDRAALRKAFSFKAGYNDGRISISIPLKNVHFREEGDTIRAEYKISVYVYRDYKKIDAPTFSKQLQFAKDRIPAEKALTFYLPYTLAQKGKYFFDVIVEDVMTSARTRNFASVKR
ncbi:MAG TPA: GWxTD domain-containing protein [Acidobacteriota bacterium]